jgi:HK97 family phage prohead protease
MERKFFEQQLKQIDSENLTVVAVISVERKDRQGDVLRSRGCRTDTKTVPVLFGHQPSEPVGKCEKIWVDSHDGYPAVLSRIKFFPDEQGKKLFQKITQGFLDQWSVGFIANDYENFHDGGRDIKVWTLLEASSVPVGACQYTTTLTEAEKSQSMQFKFYGDYGDSIGPYKLVSAGGSYRIEIPDQLIEKKIQAAVRQTLGVILNRGEGRS